MLNLQKSSARLSKRKKFSPWSVKEPINL